MFFATVCVCIHEFVSIAAKNRKFDEKRMVCVILINEMAIHQAGIFLIFVFLRMSGKV